MPAAHIENEGLAPRRAASVASGGKGLTIAVAVVTAGLIGFVLAAPGRVSAPQTPAPAVSAATQ
ncbi:MAG: hypothetical protein AB7E79_08620 [Rhodospirillaceae bacterium]